MMMTMFPGTNQANWFPNQARHLQSGRRSSTNLLPQVPHRTIFDLSGPCSDTDNEDIGQRTQKGLRGNRRAARTVQAVRTYQYARDRINGRDGIRITRKEKVECIVR